MNNNIRVIISDTKNSNNKMYANSLIIQFTNKSSVVSENIFSTLRIDDINVRVLSLNLLDDVDVIVDPIKNYDTFITFGDFLRINLFDRKYIMDICNIEYFQIFDINILCKLIKWFDSKDITERKQLIRAKSQILKFNDDIKKYKTISQNLTIPKTISQKSNNIDFIVGEIGFGFGDIIQRFNNFIRFCKSSSSSFKLVKHIELSYRNSSHNASIFNMYDFPLFSSLTDLSHTPIKTIKIGYSTFIELITINLKFFEQWNDQYTLLIDLSSTPGAGLSKNIHYNYYNESLKRQILRNDIQYFWKDLRMIKYKESKEITKTIKNQVIIHYRRGDYINGILSNSKSARTLNTTPYILKYLDKKLLEEHKIEPNTKINIIITSDHYNLKNIKDEHKKYIDILFDYMNNDNFMGNYNFKFEIIDKIIGKSKSNEIKFLKYIETSEFIIGNMSCLPHILAKIMNSPIKDLCRDIPPNIRSVKDLDMLLKLNKN